MRTALDGFYSRLTQARPQRLSVPKGGYRTVLDAVPIQKPLVHRSLEAGDPIVALGTLCADDHVSRGYGFEIESEMLTLISTSEFLADRLLSFTSVEGRTLDALATQAERQGACVLLVTRVMAVDDAFNAYLSVIQPRTRQILSTIRLGPETSGRDRRRIVNSVSQAFSFLALDPIDGGLVKLVSELQPQSRLARLADVFSFMETQDRKRLPTALSSAKSIVQSSTIAQALCIDMSRASFCFSTEPDIKEISFLEDLGETLVEENPESLWANLALGYVGVSSCRPKLINRAVTRIEKMRPTGSQGDDFNLLKSLTGFASPPENRSKANWQSADRSVFETIRIGLDALADPADEFSNNVLLTSHYRDVFWIQAFQISTLVEQGSKGKAIEVYKRMQRVHPNVDDYMHRALGTMIPDVDLRSKVSFGLKTVA